MGIVWQTQIQIISDEEHDPQANPESNCEITLFIYC